jgi:hypothetical protein
VNQLDLEREAGEWGSTIESQDVASDSHIRVLRFDRQARVWRTRDGIPVGGVSPSAGPDGSAASALRERAS